MASVISQDDFDRSLVEHYLRLAGYDLADLDMDNLPPEVFEDEELERIRAAIDQERWKG